MITCGLFYPCKYDLIEKKIFLHTFKIKEKNLVQRQKKVDDIKL